ncbi:MAG: hypothetical protein MJ196_04915 [Treponemataceae bacterium]|nr:hypothetical protein [Treponemataceae bacterium]
MKKILASIALFAAVCSFAVFFPGCTPAAAKNAAAANAGNANNVSKTLNIVYGKRNK